MKEWGKELERQAAKALASGEGCASTGGGVGPGQGRPDWYMVNTNEPRIRGDSNIAELEIAMKSSLFGMKLDLKTVGAPGTARSAASGTTRVRGSETTDRDAMLSGGIHRHTGNTSGSLSTAIPTSPATFQRGRVDGGR